jgi:site-specific DNA recombinase
VTAPQVEDLVVDAVLSKLDTPEIAEALLVRDQANEDTAELLSSISSQREQLDELARLFGDKRITAPEWITARDQIEARLKKSQRRLEHQGCYRDLRSIIGHGSELRSKWPAVDIGRRAAIVRTVVDHVGVKRGRPGANGLDPSRIEIVWRM